MNLSLLSLSVTPSLSKVAKKSPAGPLDVLIQVQGSPHQKQVDRPSLNLSLVVDVSGSMAGHPLQCVQEASLALLDMLTDKDRISLVSYASNVQLLAPSAPATPEHKQWVAQRLRALSAQGSTALHSGWLHGAQTLAPHVSDYAISRVLLLSDGQANVGVVHVPQIEEEANKIMAAGIGTSTFGVGVNFDETLMTGLAKGGQAFYAQNADQMCSYFVQEFKLLSRVVARDVWVSVSTKSGTKAVDHVMLNTIPQVEGRYRLSDVLSGGEAWCVVRMDNCHSSKDIQIEVTVEGKDLDGKAIVLNKEIVVGGGGAKSIVNKKSSATTVLIERVKELEAIKIQKDALEEARHGRWDQVQNLVGMMSKMSGSNAYVAGVANNLAAISSTRDANALSKEVAYASFSMSTRSALINEDVSADSDELGLRKAQQGKASDNSNKGAL